MATRKRKGISPKVRFEVFKRDSFKCQYCGRCAPEIVLELEHIEPHSKGGSDEILNLLTSCWECNNGKGARSLADDAVIRKQRDQLEELQERREQIEMMLRWRSANIDMDAQSIEAFRVAYQERVSGWFLNEAGMVSARKLVKKYGLQRALDAMDKAADQVLEFKNGKATSESADGVLRLAYVLAEPDDIQTLYRIRAQIRRRWNYVHDGIAIGLLRKIHKLGVSVDQIDGECSRLIAQRDTSFRWWQSEMEEWARVLLSGAEP
jgi:hypothetical protein